MKLVLHGGVLVGSRHSGIIEPLISFELVEGAEFGFSKLELNEGVVPVTYGQS